jgi:hypothetical protein
MSTSAKRQGKDIKRAAQRGIGRVLKEKYVALSREPLPTSFTTLLVRLESVERVQRVKARVEQLRQGLAAEKKR